MHKSWLKVFAAFHRYNHASPFNLTRARVSLEVNPAINTTIANLRGTEILEVSPAPDFPKVLNEDLRQIRNYPEQPPVIPHKIDQYQINLAANQCMGCHSRTATLETQAPPISITHYMDREGQFLATLSPRRFFCTQCHVPQNDVSILIENQFVDIDTVLTEQK